MENTMNWTTALTFFAAASYSAIIFAWGIEGHRTVALIADAELTASARAQVHQLLALEGRESMGDVASWADEIRGKEPGMSSHAVRIPFNSTQYDSNRDCSRKGRCVIYGIQRASENLANQSIPPIERLRALKFLIHYVGDIHQPLHAIKQTGKMQAQWGKHPRTLHKIWDTTLIRSLKRSPEELAQDILIDPTYTDVQQGTPEQWAMESHDIARNFIYHSDKNIAKTKETIILPNSYLRDSEPVLKKRLAAAGIRLGRLLNQLL
jgi:hypothetical protein